MKKPYDPLKLLYVHTNTHTIYIEFACWKSDASGIVAVDHGCWLHLPSFLPLQQQSLLKWLCILTPPSHILRAIRGCCAWHKNKFRQNFEDSFCSTGQKYMLELTKGHLCFSVIFLCCFCRPGYPQTTEPPASTIQILESHVCSISQDQDTTNFILTQNLLLQVKIGQNY